jgi:hypothetical protein
MNACQKDTANIAETCVLLLDLVESWYNTDLEARDPTNARISEIGLLVW